VASTTRKGLVVFSGGQDSTTCLFWALDRYGSKDTYAITFDYGQRHSRELTASRTIARRVWGDERYEAHRSVCRVAGILRSTSPLVSDNEVGHYERPEDMPGGIEPTFVPMRNALFLTVAANRAAALKGPVDIITGVSQEDYGGYPDCRRLFIDSQQATINAALGLYGSEEIRIETPLLTLSKVETVRLAEKLDGCLESLAYSHTCYDGEYPPNPKNHASILRARGFDKAGIADPLILRAKQEGLLSADYPDSGLVV